MTVPMEYLKASCLVVDDEPSMRKTVQNMLGRMGFQNVLTADNGVTALNMLLSMPQIDLILSDINMPQMSGLEFYKAVRSHARHKETGFIFITAETAKKIVARAAEGSGGGYIIKPFAMNTLEAKVSEVLTKKFHPSDVSILISSFKNHLDANELDSAELDIRMAERIMPDSASIMFYLGKLAMRRGTPDGAIHHFSSAIQKKPMFVKAYDAIGEAYEALGEMEKAKQYYETAHGISPANSSRLVNLCQLHAKTGDKEKAELLLQEAIGENQISGHDTSATSHLAGELSLLKGDNNQALQIFQEALEKNPVDIAIMTSLASGLRKENKTEEAIKLYLKVLEISPSAEMYYQLGKAYIEADDKGKAVEALQAAWVRNPSSQKITQDLRALGETAKLKL